MWKNCINHIRNLLQNIWIIIFYTQTQNCIQLTFSFYILDDVSVNGSEFAKTQLLPYQLTRFSKMCWITLFAQWWQPSFFVIKFKRFLSRKSGPLFFHCNTIAEGCCRLACRLDCDSYYLWLSSEIAQLLIHCFFTVFSCY